MHLKGLGTEMKVKMGAKPNLSLVLHWIAYTWLCYYLTNIKNKIKRHVDPNCNYSCLHFMELDIKESFGEE